MVIKYWNGERWLVIDEAEANVRRKRGDRLMVREDAPAVEEPSPAPTPPADLTDDELEKLTAPSAGG